MRGVRSKLQNAVDLGMTRHDLQVTAENGGHCTIRICLVSSLRWISCQAWSGGQASVGNQWLMAPWLRSGKGSLAKEDVFVGGW